MKQLYHCPPKTDLDAGGGCAPVPPGLKGIWAGKDRVKAGGRNDDLVKAYERAKGLLNKVK